MIGILVSETIDSRMGTGVGVRELCLLEYHCIDAFLKGMTSISRHLCAHGRTASKYPRGLDLWYCR